MLSSFSFHSPSPALALLASEPARAFVDLVASRAPRAAPAIGDGHRVIVYPGLGAGAWSTLRLRSTLAAAGFGSVDWGFGLNRGPRGNLRDWLNKLAAAADAESTRDGRKVSLVGWSLGGIYAREIARAVPHAVRHVVTLGSPFGAEAEATHAGWLYRLLSGSEPPQSPRELQGLRRPLPVRLDRLPLARLRPQERERRHNRPPKGRHRRPHHGGHLRPRLAIRRQSPIVSSQSM